MEDFNNIYTRALHYIRKSIGKESIPIKASSEDIISEGYILLIESGEKLSFDSLIKYCVKIFHGYKYEQIGLRFKQRHSNKTTERQCKKCNTLKHVDNFRKQEDGRFHFIYYLNTCEDCMRPVRKEIARIKREKNREKYNAYQLAYRKKYLKSDRVKAKIKEREIKIKAEKSDAYIKRLIYTRTKLRTSFIDAKMISTVRELIERKNRKEKAFFYDILLNKKHITEFDKQNMHNILHIEERAIQLRLEIKEKYKIYWKKYYVKHKKKYLKLQKEWFKRKMSEDSEFINKKLNYYREYNKKYYQKRKEENLKERTERVRHITANPSPVFA